LSTAVQGPVGGVTDPLEAGQQPYSVPSSNVEKPFRERDGSPIANVVTTTQSPIDLGLGSRTDRRICGASNTVPESAVMCDRAVSIDYFSHFAWL
jgi:hypothetical protein